MCAAGRGTLLARARDGHALNRGSEYWRNHGRLLV